MMFSLSVVMDGVEVMFYIEVGSCECSYYVAVIGIIQVLI